MLKYAGLEVTLIPGKKGVQDVWQKRARKIPAAKRDVKTLCNKPIKFHSKRSCQA